MWTEMSDESILQEIGRRIKEERIRRDLQQKEVAVNAGIGIATVNRLERGDVVSLENLIRVLRVLDMLENIDFLLPKQPISPILMRKLQGKRKFRVRK